MEISCGTLSDQSQQNHSGDCGRSCQMHCVYRHDATVRRNGEWILSDAHNLDDCCHCAISQAINEFVDDNSPVNLNQIIHDLSTCICELIAYFADPSVREQVAKDTAEMIPQRVQYFREIGRYPGGECSDVSQSGERPGNPSVRQEGVQ